ncbi:MAG TPA: hypothetical protein VJB94_04430 [Candidatus Nanoarchaeia archaeon]|nr:hypothetical protein [Candidatus Nanoarchaeia archaeon]
MNFSQLPSDFRILIDTNKHNHLDAYNILEQLHTRGICLTLGRPASNLKSLLNAKGISTENLTFIDCITKKIKESKRLDDCYYANIDNFSEVFAAIDAASSEIKGKKFLILDSLNELSMHHGYRSLIFLDFLHNMLATHNSRAIFLTNNMQDQQIRAYIENKCDKKIMI